MMENPLSVYAASHACQTLRCQANRKYWKKVYIQKKNQKENKGEKKYFFYQNVCLIISPFSYIYIYIFFFGGGGLPLSRGIFLRNRPCEMKTKHSYDDQTKDSNIMLGCKMCDVGGSLYTERIFKNQFFRLYVI